MLRAACSSAGAECLQCRQTNSACVTQFSGGCIPHFSQPSDVCRGSRSTSIQVRPASSALARRIETNCPQPASLILLLSPDFARAPLGRNCAGLSGSGTRFGKVFSCIVIQRFPLALRQFRAGHTLNPRRRVRCIGCGRRRNSHTSGYMISKWISERPFVMCPRTVQVSHELHVRHCGEIGVAQCRPVGVDLAATRCPQAVEVSQQPRQRRADPIASQPDLVVGVDQNLSGVRVCADHPRHHAPSVWQRQVLCSQLGSPRIAVLVPNRAQRGQPARPVEVEVPESVLVGFAERAELLYNPRRIPMLGPKARTPNSPPTKSSSGITVAITPPADSGWPHARAAQGPLCPRANGRTSVRFIQWHDCGGVACDSAAAYGGLPRSDPKRTRRRYRGTGSSRAPMLREGQEWWPPKFSGESNGSARTLLNRADILLRAFDERHQSLSLAGLAARTKLPRTTAYRIADQMVRLGWLSRVEGRYIVGRRCLRSAP